MFNKQEKLVYASVINMLNCIHTVRQIEHVDRMSKDPNIPYGNVLNMRDQLQKELDVFVQNYGPSTVQN